MRNLTITRRKSFVGCAVKDQLYIQDAQAPEVTIDGVGCRKLGTLKNGETKTFEIASEAQQLFVVTGKTKCNTPVTIAQGQEDVVLSGVHEFVLGSNPFRFDGIELTAQEQAKRKKNNRKGYVSVLLAILLGAALGYFLTTAFFGNSDSPKTFTKDLFEITLTDAFEEQQQSGFYACYASESVVVFAIREPKALFAEDMTPAEYGRMVLEANGKTNLKLHQTDEFVWFEYTETPDGEMYYYLASCYKGNEAYWVVNFATPESNRSDCKDLFLDWADTVKAG